jgi:hypothetical protein
MEFATVALKAHSILQVFAILIFCASALPSAASDKATVLSWEDLVPTAPALEDPFRNLSYEDRAALDTVLQDRRYRRRGFFELGSERDNVALTREAELEAMGIEVERLEKANDALFQEIERRNQEVATNLDGTFVRLPGYALPLEMSDLGVTEMLLVPFVGACIHVPPPPPNQTVFVRMAKPYLVTSLYEPIWITGTLKIERASRALKLFDGETDIPVGYTLQAITIEPYQN